jgi:molybdopterin converting factor small subunit
MAVVTLRSPLRQLADDNSRVEVAGATLADALKELQRKHPRLRGWVLDERGAVREHVNVFVNGERATLETNLGEGTRVDIIQNISGGAPDEIELLVGTNKGLFVLRGERGGSLQVAGRKFEGIVCEYAIRDARTGTYYASVTHGQYGPHLYLTDDVLGEWEEAQGPAFPEDAGTTVKRTWVIQPGEEDGVLYAGVAPAALFESSDGGRSWELNRALWDQPTRSEWPGGAGGLCLHSIATWPGRPEVLAIGISAVGVWLTEDGGKSWRNSSEELIPRYEPEDAPRTFLGKCVHNLHRSPVQPETMYLQFHGGVYRTDDAGESWVEIGQGTGLPSDFGFPLVVDPRDPDRAFVIPLTADLDRVTPEGKVRVFETSDRGASWHPLTQGLPQQDSYLTILRQAFCQDGRDPLGLYFGAESGEVFGSDDGGRTWITAADHLPPVTSVRAS